MKASRSIGLSRFFVWAALMSVYCYVNEATVFATAPQDNESQRIGIQKIWQDQRTLLTNGRITLRDFWFVAKDSSITSESIHKILKLDSKFDPSILVQQSPPASLPPSAMGSGEWGRLINIVFENQHIYNKITHFETSGKLNEIEINTFDGIQQVNYNMTNSQATIFPIGKKRLAMIGIDAVRYIPSFPVSDSALSVQADDKFVLRSKNAEIVLDRRSGFVHRVATYDTSHTLLQEIFQFQPVDTLQGVSIAKYQARVVYNEGRVYEVHVYSLQDYELNINIESDEFLPSARIVPPKSRAVIVDLRNGKKIVHTSKRDVPNVLAYVPTDEYDEHTSQLQQSGWYRIIIGVNLAILGLILVLQGTRLLRRMNRANHSS
jgi:hypothetical protein